MTKSMLLSRAVARASAVLGACLLALGTCALALASPASAFTPLRSTPKGSGENTPLNLTSTSGATHTTSSGGASIVRTIVGLAIVIAVIWGLSWILRQVKHGRDPRVSSTGLTSVAALTLGSGRSVHLVRAGSDYVLLGATEHGVAPIHRYTEQQARDAGLFDEESLAEPEQERSRVATVAGQIVSGAGRLTRQEGSADLGAFAGPGRSSDNSPVVGPRPDPMRALSQSSGLIDRLRELTVRR
ncbi:MAG TPA: flagellar biosynthetic protein FliO [Solirubrobacteraceae bacterium]|nr:flagellar biosynthetic protein FliO [Solirubrobacteraceae bacterium]